MRTGPDVAAAVAAAMSAGALVTEGTDRDFASSLRKHAAQIYDKYGGVGCMGVPSMVGWDVCV